MGFANRANSNGESENSVPENEKISPSQVETQQSNENADVSLKPRSSKLYGPMSTSIQVHGQYYLPPGYRLYWINRQVLVKLTHPELKDQGKHKCAKIQKTIRNFVKPRSNDLHLQLAASQNFPKLAVSVGQLLFACATLYRARGIQLDQYGYAAFGLTVAPYAIMSLVNLIAGFIGPEFSHRYIVKSKILDEAMKRGGKFDCTVGELVEDEPDSQVGPIGRYKSRKPSTSEIWCILASLILMSITFAAPHAILSGFTGFQKRNSTFAQRFWTMSWLITCQVYGFIHAFWNAIGITFYIQKGETIPKFHTVTRYVMIAAVTPFAIGGFVTVGQMIRSYGVCINI